MWFPPSRMRSSLPITLAVVLMLLAAPARAALPGAAFEGADGDFDSDGLPDWASFVGSPALRVGDDLPTGQTDDSLRGKEDDPAPGIDVGSIPNNKSDLLRFYVVHDPREIDGEIHDFLYLAWTRANTLGTANMDFEFNQASTISENGSTPVRTPGDMLITFAFANGGNTVNLGLSRWTDTGPCEASNAGPCWGPITPLTGIAEGAVNESPVIDSISGQTLAELTFGEAMIDLTSAGVFDRDSCTSFGGAYVKSRSSDSFTSSMKDFIRPIDVRVSNCATVRVVKDAVPDAATAFDFTASAEMGGPTAFQLVDDGSGDADTMIFEGPFRGAVTIAESPADGWDLAGIVCSDPADVAESGGVPTGRVDLDVTPGDMVECTFTNVQRGHILVDEVTIPGGDPQSFGYTLSGDGGPLASFALADADPLFDSGALAAGTYSIATSALPDGWDLQGVTCSDGSVPTAIDLAPGETVTCTYTHVKRGRILVDKSTLPAGDPASFGFSLSGGPDGVNQGFSLTDAAAAHDSGWVRSGTYAVAEGDAGADWDLTSATCSDGSDPAAVDLAPGETVTCTFTNTRRGRVVVDKVTLPAGDPTTFGFTLSGGPDAVDGGFSLADADQPRSSAPLRPGTYAVAEGDAGTEWDLTSATCSDGSDPAVIDLAPGETVTCTFTNTRRGRVVVDKVTLPAGDPTAFGFTLSGGPDAVDDGFSVADADQPRSSAPLRSGSYAVAEGDAGSDWELTSATCSDGSDPAAIDLAPGETVTCTFTNTKRGRVVVDKVTLPAGDPTAFGFTLSGGPDAVDDGFSVADADQPRSSAPLRPGSYAVAEGDAGADWDLTSATCSDGSDPATIDLAPGETVTCTFTNTKRGRVVVDKVTLPAGDATKFGFTLSGGPDAVDDGFSVADQDQPRSSAPLRPGSYAVAEADAGEAWDLTGAVCSDGSDPAAIELDPGETVTCTFTNVERARLTVIKDALPAGPEMFTFSVNGTPESGPAPFLLADDGDGGMPDRHDMMMVHGIWTVVEADAGEAWDLMGVDCNDGRGRSRGSVNLAAGSVMLDLDPGDDVTCVFSNRKRGRIIVTKQVVNESLSGVGFDPRTWPFDFDSDFSEPFQLAHGESMTSEWLVPGSSYHVSEQLAHGWIGESSCVLPDGGMVSGGASISVPLAPGAEVECTFVNEMRIHPGTHGFWRNWSNHYVESQILQVVEGLADSRVHETWFDGNGDPIPGILDELAWVLDEPGTYTPAEKAARELTTLLLDIEVSTSDDPAIRAMQMNDDVCLDCIVDLDDRPGAEALIRDLAPCVRDDVTVGDVINAVEAQWTGDLAARQASFDNLSDSEILLLHSVLDDINNGRNVVVDPETYPDHPGCQKHPDGPTVWRVLLRDADGDGFGVEDETRLECSLDDVAGWSAVGGDCDDDDATSFPGGTEVCDLADNDCDGIVDSNLDGDSDGVDDVCDAYPTVATMSGPLYVGVAGGVDDLWRTVTLPRTWQDPIVILGPASASDPARGVPRLANVTGDSFDLRFEEWSHLDGVHGAETVPYLVIERGRHVMDDGSIWEAGSFALAGSNLAAPVSFSPWFPTTPAVLLTVQTANDPVPVTVRARDVDRRGFSAALFEEEWLMRGRDPEDSLDVQAPTGGIGDMQALSAHETDEAPSTRRSHGEETVGYLALRSAIGSGRVTGARSLLPYLVRRTSVDERDTAVAAWRLRLEKDNTDGMSDLGDESLDVVAVGPALFAQDVSTSDPTATVVPRRTDPTGDLPMEWGTVDTVGWNWTTVPLSRAYVDPVVIVKPASDDGGVPSVIRLRNVNRDGFEVTVRKWEYVSSSVAPERVFYMVVDRGRHVLGGLTVEAGTVTAGARADRDEWAGVSFSDPFGAAPAVFAAAQTFLGPDPMVTRIGDRSSAGFRVLVQEEDGGDLGHTPETIGWIALDTGSAVTGDGRHVTVSLDAVDDQPRTFTFDPMGGRFATVVADLASAVEMDACAVRSMTVDDRSIELFVEEEQSADDETDHLMEDLSLFAGD